MMVITRLTRGLSKKPEKSIDNNNTKTDSAIICPVEIIKPVFTPPWVLLVTVATKSGPGERTLERDQYHRQDKPWRDMARDTSKHQEHLSIPIEKSVASGSTNLVENMGKTLSWEHSQPAHRV